MKFNVLGLILLTAFCASPSFGSEDVPSTRTIYVSLADCEQHLVASFDSGTGLPEFKCEWSSPNEEVVRADFGLTIFGSDSCYTVLEPVRGGYSVAVGGRINGMALGFDAATDCLRSLFEARKFDGMSLELSVTK